MDHVLIFWFVAIVCLGGLRLTFFRRGAAGIGWGILLALILLLDVAGWFLGKPPLVYAAGVVWLLLVFVPGILGILCHRRLLQQRYAHAGRLARIIRWLHPADGWREQPKIIEALAMADQGDIGAASTALSRYGNSGSPGSMLVMPMLYRITNDWEGFIEWEAKHLREVEQTPQLLPGMLRARGETGDWEGCVRLYQQRKGDIQRLAPRSTGDFCRLMLFAFGGRRVLCERLLSGRLRILPAPIQKFWLATADLAAGQTEIANRQFEELLVEADPSIRRALERRLAQNLDISGRLSPEAESVLETAALELRDEERFGRDPLRFYKRSRVTQVLILLNVAMFAVEVFMGGSYNLGNLYDLGALYPPAVRAGEWWRLFASLFLHYGPFHLAMNMVALWLLGPFVESALGSPKFTFVYLLSGLGSMLLVMQFASGPSADQLTVGASGCVMALVGATAALMLRGWLREKAPAAKRGLLGMGSIAMLQTVFDAFVPNVSMAAHLSGAGLGFVATALLARSINRDVDDKAR